MLPATKFAFGSLGILFSPNQSSQHSIKTTAPAFPGSDCFLVSLFLSYVLESSVPSLHYSQITKLPIGSSAWLWSLGRHVYLGQPLWLFDCILRASEPGPCARSCLPDTLLVKQGAQKKAFL